VACRHLPDSRDSRDQPPCRCLLDVHPQSDFGGTCARHYKLLPTGALRRCNRTRMPKAEGGRIVVEQGKNRVEVALMG
jgi:hypothetical protein